MRNAKIVIQNEVEAITWAQDFASVLKFDDIVVFTGDLGSGKTFLCREIIRYFCGANTNVISPTFNLLQTYQAENFLIYHFDLYRLKHIDEIFEIGLEEAWNNNLSLIEWPEIIEPILPKQAVKIHLQILDENRRLLLCDYI